MNQTFLKIKNFLEENNHTCFTMNHLSQNMEWCMSYPCINSEHSEISEKAQDIMRKLEIDLRKKEHFCLVRNENNYPMSLEWCQKTECSGDNKHIMPFMDPEHESIPQIIFKFKNMLKNMGHGKCCRIDYREGKIYWCQNEICRFDNVEKFEKELKNNGHKCVQIHDSYPPQISWCCDKKKCIKNKKRERDS
jgi:hypothetical protein